MPIIYKKMQMHVGNVKPNVNVAQKKSAPTENNGLYAPMVSRIAGVKTGCACGK